MITAVAFLNLRHVNMKKTRNLMILGLSHLLGIAIPDYLRSNPGAIDTGTEVKITDYSQDILIKLHKTCQLCRKTYETGKSNFME